MKTSMLKSDDIYQLQKIGLNLKVIIALNHKNIINEEEIQNFIYNTLSEALEEISIIKDNFK